MRLSLEPDLTHDDFTSTFAAWRERVVLLVLRIMVVGWAVATPLALMSVPSEQLPLRATYYALVLFLLAMVAFWRNLHVRLRAWVAVFILYQSSVMFFLNSGLVGSGRTALLVTMFGAFFLLRVKDAIIFAVGALLSIGVLYAAFYTEWVPRPSRALELAFTGPYLTIHWFEQVGASVIIGVVLVSALALVQRSLRRADEAHAALAQLNRELEQHVAERTAELAESKRLIEQIADTMPDILYIRDIQTGRNLYNNRCVEVYLGYSSDEIMGYGADVVPALMHPDDRARLAQLGERQAHASDDEVMYFEYRLRHRNGGWRWLSSREVVFRRDEHGHPQHILGIAHDTTARRETEDALRDYQQRMQAIWATVSDGIVLTDAAGIVRDVNPAYCALYGYRADELVGQPVVVPLPPDLQAQAHTDYLRLFATAASHQQFEQRVVGRDGHARIIEGRIAFIEVDGTRTAMVTTVRDVTQRVEMEAALNEANQQLERTNQLLQDANAQLQHDATHDSLTGLYSRRALFDRLPAMLDAAIAYNQPLAVLMLDVDHFKQYNDTAGHAAGDVVLREVAAVLVRLVRSQDVVCRYGGEEFVVLLPNVTPLDALQRAEHIRTAIAQLRPRLQGQKLAPVTVSVGVAMCPEHSTTIEGLLYAADNALYLAKHHGRNRVENGGAPLPLRASATRFQA